MNKRHYEHTLPNIRGSLSNTYPATTVSRSFSEWFSGEVVIIFRCKDSVQTGTTLEVLTNGAAAQSSFIEPSGFAYGQK